VESSAFNVKGERKLFLYGVTSSKGAAWTRIVRMKVTGIGKFVTLSLLRKGDGAGDLQKKPRGKKRLMW